MFFGIICACFLLVSSVFFCQTAYAGKMELTTYYPAPYGEYKNVNTTENTNLANTTGSVKIGTPKASLATPTNPDPKNDNTLILLPVKGDAATQNLLANDNGVEGSLRYSQDADGAGKGGFLYRNSSSWVSLGGGGGGGLSLKKASGAGAKTVACPSGYKIIQCGAHWSNYSLPIAESNSFLAYQGSVDSGCPFSCMGESSCTYSKSTYNSIIVLCAQSS